MGSRGSQGTHFNPAPRRREMWLGDPDGYVVVGAVSPSFWWNNEETRGLVQTTAAPPLRVWIDLGTNEGSSPRATLDQVRAVASLVPFAHYREYPAASHDEASWAARLPDVLAYLFP